MATTFDRLLAGCGVVGPLAFTAAWVAGSARQPGYSIANEHISGLAAPDAEQPHVMAAGFLALGVCSVAFAWGIDRRLHGADGDSGLGPALLGASGCAIAAAGVLRRDRMSNFPSPDEPDAPQSWVNDGHDLASVFAQVASTAGLLVVSRRFARDPALRDLSGPAVRAAIASSGIMAFFAKSTTRPGNGLLQRAGVTIPLGFMVRTSMRMLRTS